MKLVYVASPVRGDVDENLKKRTDTASMSPVAAISPSRPIWRGLCLVCRSAVYPLLAIFAGNEQLLVCQMSRF